MTDEKDPQPKYPCPFCGKPIRWNKGFSCNTEGCEYKHFDHFRSFDNLRQSIAVREWDALGERLSENPAREHTELLPCPHCGSNNLYHQTGVNYGSYYKDGIGCRNCGYIALFECPSAEKSIKYADAICKWNRRPSKEGSQ